MGWTVGVRFPAMMGIFLVSIASRPAPGAHPASYSVGTKGSFTGVKAGGAWIWPLTSIYCRRQESVELYLHSPNTPPWRDAQKSHRDNFKARSWYNTFGPYWPSLITSKTLWNVRMYPKVSGLAAWSENCKWYSCIAILWVSLVKFAAITLCVPSQRVFIVAVVYFVIDSVRKLLDTPSYSDESYKCKTCKKWNSVTQTGDTCLTFVSWRNIVCVCRIVFVPFLAAQ
jgi:hypothetical protein